MHVSMLGCFSCVSFFVTPCTEACQAPTYMKFSRQEYWSGLPFPSSGMNQYWYNLMDSSPYFFQIFLAFVFVLFVFFFFNPRPHPEYHVTFIHHVSWLTWTVSVSSVQFSSVQFSSVTQSYLTLCDPMNHSTPGLPVHHQLLGFTQTHVHWVTDAIQPSYHHSSLSPPAPSPSQHHGLFQSALHMRRPKYWSFSFSINLSNKHPGLISFRMDWLDLLEFLRLVLF